MGYKKGISGNPKGRKKGSKNKVTQEIRERLRSFIDDEYENILKDMKGLEPERRVDVFVKLLEYVIPKLTRTQQENVRESKTYVVQRKIIYRCIDCGGEGENEKR